MGNPEKEHRDLLVNQENGLRLFNILANSSSDPIFLLDSECRITAINNRIEHYGYNTSDLTGRLFTDLIPEDYKLRAKNLVVEKRAIQNVVKDEKRTRQAQTANLPFFDRSHESKSSEEHLLQFNIQSIRVHDGDPIKRNHTHTIGIARELPAQTSKRNGYVTSDAEKQARTADQMRDSEEMFRTIADKIPGVSIRWCFRGTDHIHLII